jgi:hypothetical protein
MEGNRSRCKLSFFLLRKLGRREFSSNLNGNSSLFRSGWTLTTAYAFARIFAVATMQSRRKVLQPRQLSQFLWSLRMRGDCRSNDAVDSLTGNSFTP